MMPAATGPDQPKTKHTLSKEDEEDLLAINDTLERMCKVLPPDPYVLTIPQDVEPRYHHPHHPAYTEQWRYKTPFVKGEHESLQYQTFIYHELGKDMYVLHSSRPSDEPSKNASSNKTKPATGANTPNNSAPKKKMTFSDYKKKTMGSNATATPEKSAVKAADSSKQGAVKGPVERAKAETEEMLAAVAESEAEVVPAKQERKAPNQHNELKRKWEEEVVKPKTRAPENAQESAQPTAVSGNAEPAAKKLKMAQEKSPTTEKNEASREDRAQKSSKLNKHEQPAEVSVPLGMPPRLSPGMPDRLTPPRTQEEAKSSKRSADKRNDAETGMPRRLSDTIPDNILKTLNSRANGDMSAPNFASKSKDGKLTPLPKANGIVKKKSPIPKNGFRASSSPAIHPDTEEQPYPKSSAVRDTDSLNLSQGEGIAFRRAAAPDRPGASALLVKLKFKKAMRESVQRMLKTRPQPGRDTLPSLIKRSEGARKTTERSKDQRLAERSTEAPQKGLATKVGPVKKEPKPPTKTEQKQPVATKRPPADDDKLDGPTKRTKTHEQRNQPSTPASKEVDSPMAQKPALPATPGTRKDHLSAKMQRQQSQDSVTNYNTPPALPSTPSISTSSGQTNGMVRVPSSQPSAKTPKQHAWEAERQRLENLGREIKRAAGAEFSANPSDLRTQKLAAIKNIEAFLCYMIAYTCADEASLAADPRHHPSWKVWRGLFGFYGFVKQNTKQFGLLNGLICALGMVYHARILDIATQYPSDGPDRSVLQETIGYMQRAAMDAEAKLDLDSVMDGFPDTWSKRSKTLLSTEKLEPAKYLRGPYKLPMGLTTSPIRAARAGHAMLTEWIEKEKIDYSLKLKL